MNRVQYLSPMDDYYTTEQIAEKLQVEIQTILRYIRAKKLVALRLGKGYRIAAKDLETFLKKYRTV